MESSGVSVFVNAVSAGSLSAAARRLGIAPMMATRRLSALEEELGVRLMQRTTRSVSLTPEGEAFLPFASTMIEAAEAGRAVVAPAAGGATGLLRVTACGSIGRTIIMPRMPKLLAEHPGLKIDLLLTDTVVDIVSTGVDVAIRIAAMKDSGLVASALASNPRRLFASPEYLARRGTPERLEDLADHDLVTTSGTMHWIFSVNGGERPVRINARVTASSIQGIHDACVSGVGIGILSTYHVQPELHEGRLVPVRLWEGDPTSLPISAVYPTNRQVLPKVRAFVEALRPAFEARGTIPGALNG